MSRSTPFVLAAGLLAAALPLAAPASADTGPVTLGMASFARIVADEANGRLFLSPGPSGTGVRVTDLHGGSARTIDGLPGATGLTLTPDGLSLWVTLPTAGALKKVDTTTLAITQTIALPTGQCPGDVAVVGTRLVYGHSCHGYGGGGGYGGLGVVDAATGASHGSVTDGPYYRPVVATGPAGQVYAADAGLSPTRLSLYDVAGDAPRLVAARASTCENLRDLSARPDGSQVVTACGYPYEHQAWSAAQLEPAGSFFSGPYPVAGAWSGDGGTFVAGLDSTYEPDVYVHRVGEGMPVRDVDFGGTTSLLQPRGLVASRDGLRAWAVASSPSGLALHVIDVPSPTSARITVSATPDASYPGTSTTVSGRVADLSGQPLAAEVLQVVRGATGEVPVALPDVVTDEAGTFELVDTPPGDGSYVYSVSRAVDGARAEVTVLVWSTEGTLLLELTRGTSGGPPVSGTVQLYYSGPDSTSGLTVSLVREAGGLLTPLPSLTTDAKGRASFTDDPPAGEVTYRATVAENGRHPEVTATGTTTVLTATTLTAKAPSPAPVGLPLTVSGVLTAPAGPVAGATVQVVRSGCSSTTWLPTATTTPNGSWTATDASPPLGTCTYSASYAGGGGYAASTATTSTTITLRPTVLTATSPDTVPAGSPVHLAGRLTSGTAAVGGATVSVSRSGCSATTASTPVTTAADGSWSLVDPAAPGGACTWTATYAGDSTYAAATGTASTRVSFLDPALSLSVVHGTGRMKKQVVVTGQLGTTYSNRTLTLTAQPVNGTETVLLTGQVDSTGQLRATYTPKTTTTYRVRFSGDAWYAPKSVEQVQ